MNIEEKVRFRSMWMDHKGSNVHLQVCIDYFWVKNNMPPSDLNVKVLV